jgi:hypothetical protein
MYYDEESGAVNFVAGMLLGAVLGASLALLTAPQGERWEDLTDEVQDAVKAGRKRIRL